MSKNNYNANASVYYRKVQVVGKSTFIISLPKDWVKLYKIEPGTLLAVRKNPAGSLVIEPPMVSLRKGKNVIKVELEPEDIGKTIRECISAYIAGYNEIVVLFDEKYREKAIELRKLLEEIALGLNVLEEGPNFLKFYIVIDPRSMKFLDVVSRACKVTRSMISDISRACTSLEKTLLESVIERDQLVDKLYILALKQLTGALLGNFRISELGLRTMAETVHIFIAIKSIERIADHATIVASELLRLGPKKCPSKNEIVDMLNIAESLVNSTCNSLIQLSKIKAHEIARRASKLRERVRGVRDREILKGNILTLRIFDSIERMAGYLIDISEAMIDISTIRFFAENK